MSSINPKRRLLARAFQFALQDRLWLAAQKRCLRPFIRSLNYHAVPARHADNFEKQLQFYQRHFCPVGYHDLLGLFEGRWEKPKPGLIISFDDGLRDNAEVAAELLDKYGFVGWFFVVPGFIDAPEQEQLRYAQEHQIIPRSEHDPNDPRTAMSWEQVRALADRHVIGCHTYTHRRLREELTDEELDLEIPQAKRRLEEALGREVDVFCWVGGEQWSYSRRAARAVTNAGFRLGFMTNSAPIRPGTDPLQLQRTNVECDWDDYIVSFMLSGFMDLIYTRKRRRVNRLTGPIPPR